MTTPLRAIALRPDINQAGAIAAVVDALKPASRVGIEDALVRLGEKVDAPYGSDPDKRLEEFAAILLQYPADAAFAALQEWPATHTKWPKEAELRPILSRLSLYRRRILTALQGFDATKAEADLYPKPTEADKAAVRASLARFKSRVAAEQAPKRPDVSPAMQQRLDAAKAADLAEREAYCAEVREAQCSAALREPGAPS